MPPLVDSVNKFSNLIIFVSSIFLQIGKSKPDDDEKSKFIPNSSKENSLLYHPMQQISLQSIPALKYSDLFMDIALSRGSDDEEEVEITTPSTDTTTN